MKYLLNLISLLFLLASCSSEETVKVENTRLIPNETELVMITPDFSDLKKDLLRNPIVLTNSSNLKSRIQNQLSFLNKLRFNSELLVTFSSLENETFSFTISTRKDSSFFQLDSLPNKKVESFKENGVNFKRYTLENDKFLVTEVGDYYIISNSRTKLSQISKGENLLEDEKFKKVLASRDPTKTSIILSKNLKLGLLDNFFSGFGQFSFEKLAGWTLLDLDLEGDHIKINGITLKSEEPNYQDLLSDQQPGISENSNLIPSSFTSFSTINYNNFEIFDSQRSTFTSDSIQTKNKLFNFSSEISKIELKNGAAYAIGLKDLELGKEALIEIAAENLNFRDVVIFRINNSEEIVQKFKPFYKAKNLSYACILDNSAVFSEELSVLEEMISASLSASLLSNQNYFQDFIEQLTAESSLFFLAKTNNFNKAVFNSQKTLENNSLFAIQFISQDNFTHIHGIFSAGNKNTEQIQDVAQTNSFKIEKSIAGKIQFFRNHETNQMDIVAQDENNMLYLLSNKGTLIWKKQLESTILGAIHEVDLFKNSNKQLAFSTGNELQVLDRNGNYVKPFPTSFKDRFTQPLAVFDYDKNRIYRFVLTQNNKVYMLGPKGKSIQGFNFENATSEIVAAPKHIRLDSKDYILIAEKAGILNILSRQGTIRVPVTETIQFSENEWFGHKGKFVSTTADYRLIEIDQTGKVSIGNEILAENVRLAASDENLVYLNENELNINGKTLTLDFGLYTDPQIFEIEKNTYVGITDLQTSAVFVFDKNAQLLTGFPVYGTSEIDLSNADVDSKKELITKGEENELLVYEF